MVLGDNMTKVKTVYKIKWKNMAIVFVVLLLLGALVFGGIKVGKYFVDSSEIKEEINKIKENIVINNLVDDEFTTTIKPDSSLSKFDIYWDYIKLGLVDADLESLKRINSDTIGYVEIKGTSFVYPIVKGDNDFYKNHSFEKKENSLGWIYVDDEFSDEELKTNTIIYGNKVFGNVLMGSLSEVFNNEWKEDKNNFIIKFSTNYYSTLWQVISVYHTQEDDHLKCDFENEEVVKKYKDSIISKSEIKFKAGALSTDKFLTITTNSGGTNVVVQAKLIKIREEI